jgi:hypothetical protein
MIDSRLIDRPIPLQLSIAEAHLTAVACNRVARELEDDGSGETIITAAYREIVETLERQIGTGLKAIDLTRDEIDAVVAEVKTYAESLGEANG